MKTFIKVMGIWLIPYLGWIGSITLFKLYQLPEWINIIYIIISYSIWLWLAILIALKKLN